MSTALGDYLRARRLELGLTLATVTARTSCMTQGTLSEVERGIVGKPLLWKFPRVAYAYEADLEHLYALAGVDPEQVCPFTHTALGDRIRELRIARGMTTQDCIRASGIGSIWYKLQRGVRLYPCMKTIQTISGVLGVPVAELVGLLPPRPPVRGRRSRGEAINRALAARVRTTPLGRFVRELGLFGHIDREAGFRAWEYERGIIITHTGGGGRTEVVLSATLYASIGTIREAVRDWRRERAKSKFVFTEERADALARGREKQRREQMDETQAHGRG